MSYEALPKTVPRVKIAAEPDLRVPEALLPISELKIPTDFENLGYLAVLKTVPRIKWVRNQI